MKPCPTHALFLSIAICLTLLTGCASSRDVYVYGIPEGARFSYTDIPMVECSWCHRVNNLNRHHIVPKSVDPSKRNDPHNIVVLCRECHFVLGHRCNWKHYNPDVLEMVNTYTNTLTVN